MIITETLKSEISALISGNHMYDSYYKIWRDCLESYLGGEEYRRAQNLVRYQLENNNEYLQRLKYTPLINHCQSVISVYNSFLFREEPHREFGSIENLPELKDFLKDADFEGKSLNQFMKDVSVWSSVFGHCFIFVTKSNINASNRAEEYNAGVRPYVSIINPIMVLDWDYQRQLSGRYELVYIKYLEDVNGDVRTVKKWYPDRIETTVVDVKKDEIISEETVPNQLGKIPAVLAYNKQSTFRGIGVSDIQDIKDCQRFIYNCISEIRESIAMDTHPSLCATNEVNIGTGPGSIIRLPDNLPGELKPYALEFNSGSIDKIYQAIERTEQAIDKMANTGAVRATESKTMSGVAMETEFQLLNAKLSEKADNLELAEEQMWKLWCEYQGTTWDGEIDYPGSFNIRDTQNEINQLKTAKETTTNPSIQKEIDYRIMEWLGMEEKDYEDTGDTYQTHTMMSPDGQKVTVTTMEQHNELVAQGYLMGE